MTKINLTAIETEGEADGAEAVSDSVREADSAAEVAAYEPGGWVDAARNAGAHTFADSMHAFQDDEAARAAYYAAYDRGARAAQHALAAQNYHLTWTESGSTSSAWTDAAPGAYPATEASAAHVVAPGAFVRGFCAERDPRDEFPGTAEDAVRAWAREQGHYCA